jgi:hypothetical protein
MDLSRYRELLASFHDVVLACGGRTSRATGKWLADFDRGFADETGRHQLLLHLAQVSRSAEAIAILTGESISSESLPLSKDILDHVASDLLVEVKRLQEILHRTGQVLEDRGVHGLVDEDLSSVVFVMDYAQFGFNGASLTSFVWPIVHHGEKALSEAEPGYRDALCRLIGLTVLDVAEDAESLTLDFGKGVSLSISLRPEDAVGPENATFISETGLLWVW